MIVILGAGVGVGLELVRRSVVSASLRERTVRFVMRRFGVADVDLAVTGSSAAKVATTRLVTATLLAAIPLVAFVVTAMFGTALPIVMVVTSAVAGAAVGFVIPATQTKQQARAARERFRTSLSAYLDLVSTMLAGGAGIETALVAAVRVGDGPAFAAIGDALDRARSSRRSPWDELAAEGDRIGIPELPELAATVRLGGEQGARMTASLIAKATSMRSKQMAEIEARANAATERMGLPMVMLFLGFLVLLGYPAVQMIGAGFTT